MTKLHETRFAAGDDTVHAVLPAASNASSHVILTEDYGDMLKGKVIRRESDLMARMELEGAKFRDASPREIELSGAA